MNHSPSLPTLATQAFSRITGTLVIVAGVAIAALAIRRLVAASPNRNPFSRRGSELLADDLSQIVWGVMIFTIGCYIWRAARRRGWKDRLGRSLIAIGYLALAYAMSASIHSAVRLGTVKSEAVRDSVMLETGLLFLGFGAPAAFLVWLGVRMADEIIITTVSGNMSQS